MAWRVRFAKIRERTEIHVIGVAGAGDSAKEAKMGWTVYYDATSTKEDIDLFVSTANEAKLTLSSNCEPYQWEATDARSAKGWSKAHFSDFPDRDFVTILTELQDLSKAWTHVHITVTDDYYLDHQDIRGIQIDRVLD